MAKKILLVANTAWYLYNFRLELIKEISRRGDLPVVVSPPGDYVEKFQDLHIRHIPWNVGRRSVAFWKELGSLADLQSIYMQESPDLVHHHTNKAVLYGSSAARKLTIPVVNSVAGRGYVFLSADLSARLLLPFVSGFFRLVLAGISNQRVIFENRDDRKYFVAKKFVPEEKTILIPSVGADPEKFVPTEPPTAPPLVVGFAGRLLKDKGVGIFARAAGLLKQRGIDCRMVLAGLTDPGNPNSFTDEEISAWQDAGLVEWWGWQEDMNQFFSQIHLLAYPTSYGEGVPTILAEAGLSKRAVIASDWPGCREIITHGETGLLVPINDPAVLADAIQMISSNPGEYDRMRLALYELSREKFSTTYVNARTLAVYDELLKEA